MSTLSTANYDSSSDAEDADFVPDVPKTRSSGKRKAALAREPKFKAKQPKLATAAGGVDGNEEQEDGGESSAESSGNDSEDEGGDAEDGELDGGDAKRRKMEEEEQRRRVAREAFAAFANEDSAGAGKGEDGSKVEGEPKAVEMVEVKRPRQFAGETIYETVRLSADHPDAVAYLAGQQSPTEQPATVDPTTPAQGVAPPAGEPLAGKEPVPATASSANKSSEAPCAASAQAPASDTSSAPASSIPPKRPPPKRKPRQSLEAMSAALDKGKKMTTLEKSQMDWQSHTSSTKGLSDELASNRKSGGYLEKREFLDRVDDRRIGAFEQQKKGQGRR